MATPRDAGAIADIYELYVRDTVISFETAPPNIQEMRSRLTTTLDQLRWLVITDGDCVKGYAYASPQRARDAYRWCADGPCTWIAPFTAEDMVDRSTPHCSICLAHRATSTLVASPTGWPTPVPAGATALVRTTRSHHQLGA
jgi:phosphinothricin acetyltransferase